MRARPACRRGPLLQDGGSGGDPAGAQTQGGLGPHGGGGRPGRVGVGPGRLGEGGLALFAIGARPRHRRRPRLGSAGQAGPVGSHRPCPRPGLAPVGGASGGRPRRWRGARHDRLRGRRSLRQPGLAGATSGGHRDSVVRSAKGGVGAGCISRDRKSGKRQIVIGLLSDADGRPLSTELFASNTSDVKTSSSQLSKAAARFGAERGPSSATAA